MSSFTFATINEFCNLFTTLPKYCNYVFEHYGYKDSGVKFRGKNCLIAI